MSGFVSPPNPPAERGYSFSGWQVGNPTLPPPGDSLDLEFDRAFNALELTVSWAKQAITDDGQLRSASVGLAQLKPEVLVSFPAGVTPALTALAQQSLDNANAAAASAAAAAANIGVWSVFATGTANAIILTPTPALASYSTGLAVRFISGGAANTGPVTVNISGLGARNVRRGNGTVELRAGELSANSLVEMTFDGTQFRVVSMSALANQTIAGNLTLEGFSDQLTLAKSGALSRSAINATNNGLFRWAIFLGSDDAELGGDTGSRFQIARFRDNGSYVDIPFQIFRDTGIANFTHRPTFGTTAPAGWLARIPEVYAPRNRIIHPSMRFDQEREGAAVDRSVTGQDWVADQWRQAVILAAGPGTLRGQRTAIPTPGGSSHRLRFTAQAADAALAAGDQYTIEHPVEGHQIADARFGIAGPLTLGLRFGVRSSVAGTFGVSLANAAGNRSWVSTFTIAPGEVNLDLVREFVLSADSTGTWLTDNQVGVWLRVCLAAGTNWHGTAGWQVNNFLTLNTQTNFMATAAATFDLFDAGFYADPRALGVLPPWLLPNFDEELAACQRFYEKSYNLGVAPGTANALAGSQVEHTQNNGNFRMAWPFKVRKRVPGAAISLFSPVTGAAGQYRRWVAPGDLAATVNGESAVGEYGFTSGPFTLAGVFELVSQHFVANARF